ncbi:MAG TPA: hypothetical protein VFH38_00660 [Jatrophihabitans sp.]|nr:hypothetical protein [Jatrophihabitans sp.]
MASSTSDPAAGKRIVLHIGLHKTGTTYLQHALQANAAELRAQGVYVPVGRNEPRLLRAVDDLHGRRQVKADNARIDGAWSRLVTRVLDVEQPTVLLSDERLSLSSVGAIGKIKRSFEGCELRVVVTVRDPARVVVSSWEEAIRGGGTWRWPDYVDAVSSPERRGANPARAFWARQDLARITAAWEALVANDAIYVVTVPQRSGSPRALLERFADAVGFDPGPLTREPRRANTAIGPAGTEVVRRLNESLAGRLDRRRYDDVVKYAIAPHLSAAAAAAPAPAVADDAWLREMAEAQIRTLSARGYRIVGDLDDLRPAVPAGAQPGTPGEAELLDAAMEALVGLALKHAESAGSRPGQAAPGTASSDGGSRLRRLAFAGRRAVLRAADEGGVLEPAVALAYRAREARQEHAMHAARRRRRRSRSDPG